MLDGRNNRSRILGTGFCFDPQVSYYGMAVFFAPSCGGVVRPKSHGSFFSLRGTINPTSKRTMI